MAKRTRETEESTLQYVKRMVKLWPGSWALVVAFAAWFVLPRVLLWLDPTSVRIDDGIWQLPVLAVTFVMIFSEAVFAAIKFNFPQLWKQYTDQMDGESADGRWSSPFFFLAIYAVLLLGFVLVTMAIA
ncbi:hypothetical protein UFOVP350_9 [uncultured Caudovirales phage]|uniref:Uncharacterized protein n=1 Tax=uncultured Caudovirales phage TaxID=2100421 RepID=A0A6J5LW32_9CAUD|nr:hypothetical protein UFOVP350_9 [uncultured Caudovirales phage]